jgi:hypothetical protein
LKLTSILKWFLLPLSYWEDEVLLMISEYRETMEGRCLLRQQTVCF